MKKIRSLIKEFKYRFRKSLIYLTEYPLRPLDDRDHVLAIDQKIPSVVYQTWESKFFGKTHAKEIEKFRNINPELSFKIYTDQMVDEYMKNSWGTHPIYRLYLRSLFGPMRADIFRYCIIYEFGGYYFDISKGCNQPLTKLHGKNDTGLISFEPVDCYLLPDIDAINKIQHPEKYVLQWGFGFTKEHPILARVIENICNYWKFFENSYYEIPKNAILMLTGPGMFTKSFREVLAVNLCGDLCQAGINFNGFGVFSLPRSEARYLRRPAYQFVRNQKIIKD